jgi:hypothetical protein
LAIKNQEYIYIYRELEDLVPWFYSRVMNHE